MYVVLAISNGGQLFSTGFEVAKLVSLITEAAIKSVQTGTNIWKGFQAASTALNAG